jgi:hypothetical protein
LAVAQGRQGYAQLETPTTAPAQTTVDESQRLDCEAEGNACDQAYCQCQEKNMKDLPCYHKINGDSIFYNCDGVLTSDDEFMVMRKKLFVDLNVCIKDYETCYTKLPEITTILPNDVWPIFFGT